MIFRETYIYNIERDRDGAPVRFVQSLPDVIDWHMSKAAKMFRPLSLQRDFLAQGGIEVSRQAIYSALMSLMRRGRVRRDGRGLYRHTAHD